MKFTINYTFEDFYEAQKIVIRFSKIKYVFLAFGILNLISIILSLLVNDLSLWDVLSALWAVILLFYPQTIVRFLAYYQYKQSRHIHTPVEFVFDETGVSTKSKFESGKSQWSKYNKFIVTNRLLLLFITPRLITIVPRRVLSSDKQWNELLQLVKSKVKKQL